MLVRYCINAWVEESGMLGDIQWVSEGDLRQRIIEMAKVKRECLLVAFIYMEKAYDRVNINSLVEIMRCCGVKETSVDVRERIYDGSMVKFELGDIITG